MRFSALPRFSYNDLLKPFLIGSFTPVKFHESLWSICNFWTNSPKSIVLSLQFVFTGWNFLFTIQVNKLTVVCEGAPTLGRNSGRLAVSMFWFVAYFLVFLGLDSSNIIDSRISITFFNFPETSRRYIRYIFEIAVEFVSRAMLQCLLHCVGNIAYSKV